MTKKRFIAFIVYSLTVLILCFIITLFTDIVLESLLLIALMAILGFLVACFSLPKE